MKADHSDEGWISLLLGCWFCVMWDSCSYSWGNVRAWSYTKVESTGGVLPVITAYLDFWSHDRSPKKLGSVNTSHIKSSTLFFSCQSSHVHILSRREKLIWTLLLFSWVTILIWSQEAPSLWLELMQMHLLNQWDQFNLQKVMKSIFTCSK